MTNAEILAGLVCGALVITAIILAARAVVRWIERKLDESGWP